MRPASGKSAGRGRHGARWPCPAFADVNRLPADETVTIAWIWEPGEHNGTFRGNNPAFVTATAALETYWRDGVLRERTLIQGGRIERTLRELCSDDLGPGTSYRGRGLVWGLEFQDKERAAAVCRRAFENGLLIETSGPADEVVKLLPSLTISPAELEEGLEILTRSVREAG
ncbi:aminotransferase class III-fold pyridoxal phosphate-dependent enzyme [Streptomyces sp. ISL-94]|nr:aminotransferase class III-fold pyridoxal phosphate-dependent enzyme [Streptomyces sp. ISL-94]